MSTPRLPITFGYWDTPQGPSPASGQLRTVTSPDTVTCTHGYDGPLLTSETWSGNVTGAVTRTYDADFREATETVAVGAATSTVTNDYDLDGLLKSVTPTGLPALTIHRRAADGLVDSTHAGPVGGGIDQSQDYNAFGELRR